METSESMIVGFDCAEEEHAAVVLNEAGEIEERLTMVNRRDTIEEELSKLIIATPSDRELIVVVEGERSHGRIVADVAQELGITFWKVNPLALNRFREVEGQPRKDDEWDAYLAARMVFLRTKGCREVVEFTNEERALSRLGRTHDRLMLNRVRYSSQLRAHLLELAPEILHGSWAGPKAGSKALGYLLERWPGFIGMERAQLRSIEKILHRCRYGKRAKEAAKLLRDMPRRIAIDQDERAAITLEISLLVRQIQLCDDGLTEVDTRISERVQRHPIGKKLLEVPGIGEITAGVLISELLPVARTTTEAKSATFSGVTPLSRKTGKMPNRPRLARGVNKRVLNALYHSSVAAVSHSAIDKAYFHKKLRDYEGHPKPSVAAFIALSRQRHKVIFKLLTTPARYNKETLIGSHLERLDSTHDGVA